MREVEIAKHFVLIGRAGRTQFNQELLNRSAVRARHASGGAEAVSLDQTGDYPDFFFNAQLVHVYTLFDRSSIVN